VLYTDEENRHLFEKYADNPKICIVVRPFTDFHNWKYARQFEENHAKNHELVRLVDWKVNMLWCEKAHFVYDAMQQGYFHTDFYGWTDIGYFRDNSYSQNEFPNNVTVSKLNKKHVYYSCLHTQLLVDLYRIVTNKNEKGLPVQPIPPNQVSVAGGFFVTYKENVEWWRDEFDAKLQLYFDNGYLVKDDQMILVDCIMTEINEGHQYVDIRDKPQYRNTITEHFQILQYKDVQADHWFSFQDFLQ
jgi:hypothetical protein